MEKFNATSMVVNAVKNLAKYQKRNRFVLAVKRGWKDYCWYCEKYEFMGGDLVCVR